MAFPHFLSVCASAWHCQHSCQMIQMFFCIIRSAQLHYPHKFNTLRAVVVRDLLVTMDTAEAKVSCARRRSKGIVDYLMAVLTQFHNVAQRGIRQKLTDTKDWQINQTSIHSQESVLGPDFSTPGKVTLSCLDWLIRLSESLFIWPLTLDQFASGHTTRSYWPSTTQLPGSLEHITPPPLRGGSCKLLHLIVAEHHRQEWL